MSEGTKNRRSSAKAATPKAKGTGTAKKASAKKASGNAGVKKVYVPKKGTPFAGNKVVERRLAFLPEADLKAATKKFLAGAKVSDLVAEFGPLTATGKALTATRLVYAVEQFAVESGKVSRIPATKAAIAKAKKAGDSNARIAARTGISY